MNGKNPGHLGIIMDGNGRWAKARGLARTQGHLEGLKAAKRIVKAASDRGISYLTLYTFSTENWKRAADEVGFIMGLVRQYLRGELDFYRENSIRIRHAGDGAGLPPEIREDIGRAMEDTRNFTGMQVILALNYGGRDEIVRAVNRALSGTGGPGAKTGFTEALLRSFLDNPDVPDPDLIIRTAGEFRTSNFLLWEGAYAEYHISEKYWPEFGEADLDGALASYGRRDRRFGGVSSPEVP
ncbi:MAG: di-trans,poly-cis-decaprenylcistransferase [Treponema sp.]|nr:di-trans,poly-cis-decaprenylcistransferase [Treponema sp.]